MSTLQDIIKRRQEEDEKRKTDLILSLKIKKDGLEVRKENLYLDENILR